MISSDLKRFLEPLYNEFGCLLNVDESFDDIFPNNPRNLIDRYLDGELAFQINVHARNESVDDKLQNSLSLSRRFAGIDATDAT